MAAFNVFVMGARDDSPTALPELAEAMARRYGLVPNELVSRLRRGRFRVKSNVDAPTAEKYKRDLEAIGARVLVEDAAISPTATPPVGVPTPPAGARPANLSLPPLNERNKPSLPPSPLAGQPMRPSQPIPASGLAAAFTDTQQQDLGALSGGALSLAALDGSEDVPPPKPTPPPRPIPEDAAFAPPAPKEKPKAKPKAEPEQPLDLFAPPDAEDANFVVDLATDEIAERAAKRASTPPPNVTETPVPTPVSLPDAGPRRFSRPHFVAGCVIALVAGFVPAHFIAQMREKSAFVEIDNQVAAAHASVDSYETYAALDGARETFREQKQDKRQSIALTSMLIWAVTSAFVGFALLRYGNFAHPRQR